MLNQEVLNKQDRSCSTSEPAFGVLKKRTLTECCRDRKQVEVADHLAVYQKARDNLATEKYELRENIRIGKTITKIFRLLKQRGDYHTILKDLGVRIRKC